MQLIGGYGDLSHSALAEHTPGSSVTRSSRLILKILSALATTTLTLTAAAQTQPLACQMVANGGLVWEHGAWKVGKFKEERFILVASGGNLSTESVGKALHGLNVQCRLSNGRSICMDDGGGFMIFDHRTLQGTWLQGLGGTVTSMSGRDSLHAAAFICERF